MNANHILVIPSWYKSDKNPISGSFFEEQARGLKRLGLKVGILCPLFVSYSSKDKYQFKQYIDKDLPTFMLTVKGVIPRSIKINYWYLRKIGYRAFKKYVAEYGNPDIIHTHTVFYGGIVAEYISRKTGIPYVITEHYSPFITGSITQKIKLNTAINVFKNSDKSIVVSHSFRRDLSKKLDISENLFEVIPNLVNPIFFEKAHTITLRENDPVVFFSNSSFDDVKNHKFLFDAYKIFIHYNHNSRLIVAGDGILKKDMVDYVKKINISSNVIFTGLLSREEVRDKLNECHIFLSTSHYETFGVVLIEALAVGRPIITTDSGGPRDIVEKFNGRIVDSWDSGDYAKVMKEVVDNYSAFDQLKISKACKEKFSETKVIRQLLSVYEDVLGG